MWQPRGHLRLCPTNGKKTLYWINIKLVQLPKHLTDGDGGPQDIWSEWILRFDLSHPSVPWPWTAFWIFIALVEELFFLLLASKEKTDQLGQRSQRPSNKCGGWGYGEVVFTSLKIRVKVLSLRSVWFIVWGHISPSLCCTAQKNINNIKDVFYQLEFIFSAVMSQCFLFIDFQRGVVIFFSPLRSMYSWLIPHEELISDCITIRWQDHFMVQEVGSRFIITAATTQQLTLWQRSQKD